MNNNTEGLVNIADTYEHAIKNLHTVSPYEQSVIAANIAQLEYIDKLIKGSDSKRIYEALAQDMASQIYRKTAIVDIFQMSAIYYKGKQAGFNVKSLYNAMNNNGDWLMSEQFKQQRKS